MQTEAMMKTKRTFIAAALMLALGGAAFADTPVGPGVTGSGGTGRDAADLNTRTGAGGEARQLRPDGMPRDRADANVKSNAGATQGAHDAQRDQSSPAVGAATGAAASGTVSAPLAPAEASMGKNFPGHRAPGPRVGVPAQGAGSSLPPAEAGMGK